MIIDRVFCIWSNNKILNGQKNYKFIFLQKKLILMIAFLLLIIM